MKIYNLLESFRKVKAESKVPQYVMRYLSCEEAAEIAGGRFGRLVDFRQDTESSRENPAGDDFPYFKSFSSGLTKDAYADFMGENHVIAVFNTQRLIEIANATGCKFLPFVYDLSSGAINEKEWRLFSPSYDVNFTGMTPITSIILCGKYPVDIDEADSMVTEAYEAGIKDIFLVNNPLRKVVPLLYLGLNDDEELIAKLPDGTPVDVSSADTIQGLIKNKRKK